MGGGSILTRSPGPGSTFRQGRPNLAPRTGKPPAKGTSWASPAGHHGTRAAWLPSIGPFHPVAVQSCDWQRPFQAALRPEPSLVASGQPAPAAVWGEANAPTPQIAARTTSGQEGDEADPGPALPMPPCQDFGTALMPGQAKGALQCSRTSLTATHQQHPREHTRLQDSCLLCPFPCAWHSEGRQDPKLSPPTAGGAPHSQAPPGQQLPPHTPGNTSAWRLSTLACLPGADWPLCSWFLLFQKPPVFLWLGAEALLPPRRPHLP